MKPEVHNACMLTILFRRWKMKTSSSTVLSAILVLLWAAAGWSATVDVSMVSFAFQPKDLTINVGDTVRWTNMASAIQHTSTSGTGCTADGKWDSGLLAP